MSSRKEMKKSLIDGSDGDSLAIEGINYDSSSQQQQQQSPSASSATTPSSNLDAAEQGARRPRAQSYFAQYRNKIPNNILLNIFSYMQTRDLAPLALVNKHWRKTSEEDVLWKQNYVSLLDASYSQKYETQQGLNMQHFDKSHTLLGNLSHKPVPAATNYKKAYITLLKRREEKFFQITQFVADGAKKNAKALTATVPEAADSSQMKHQLTRDYVRIALLVIACCVGMPFFIFPLIKLLGGSGIPDWTWMLFGLPIFGSIIMLIVMTIVDILRRAKEHELPYRKYLHLFGFMLIGLSVILVFVNISFCRINTSATDPVVPSNSTTHGFIASMSDPATPVVNPTTSANTTTSTNPYGEYAIPWGICFAPIYLSVIVTLVRNTVFSFFNLTNCVSTCFSADGGIMHQFLKADNFAFASGSLGFLAFFLTLAVHLQTPETMAFPVVFVPNYIWLSFNFVVYLLDFFKRFNFRNPRDTWKRSFHSFNCMVFSVTMIIHHIVVSTIPGYGIAIGWVLFTICWIQMFTMIPFYLWKNEIKMVQMEVDNEEQTQAAEGFY